MPKVSIIMPVFNTEKYLGEAIQSILSQSFSDFEFIIIDDGSDDNSWKIIQKFAEKYKRIKAFQNTENKGISYTRNRLIELTNTDYIAPQDSDDISSKDRIQLLYNFLENNKNYAVVSGNNEIIDENGQNIGFRKYSNDIEKNILKKSPISNGSSMFRKKLFFEAGGYDKKLNFGEDYDLWLKFYSKGYKIGILQDYIYSVRIRSGQTKSDSVKQTIRNTLFIQKRARTKYKIKASLSDYIYSFLLKMLLLFPASFILFLFKKLEYKNDKR